MGAPQSRMTTRTAKAVGACIAAVIAIGLMPAVSSSRVPTAATSETKHSAAAAKECPLAPFNVPCHGTTIESAYTFSGYREGDLSLISAKLGPVHKLGMTYVPTPPVPGMYEVDRRTITWHSLADVEIVAVYEVEVVGRGFRHKKLPTGTHSGKATITDTAGGSSPYFLFQGRRVARAASVARAYTCRNIARHAPCMGPIASEFAYEGRGGGDLAYIRAHAGPEVKTGKTADGYPIDERTFTWHSAPGVTVVAAFVVGVISTPDSNTYTFHRVSLGRTGSHSGEVTLKAIIGGGHFQGALLLEGHM
jgi:hypothetical protein